MLTIIITLVLLLFGAFTFLYLSASENKRLKQKINFLETKFNNLNIKYNVVPNTKPSIEIIKDMKKITQEIRQLLDENKIGG